MQACVHASVYVCVCVCVCVRRVRARDISAYTFVHAQMCGYTVREAGLCIVGMLGGCFQSLCDCARAFISVDVCTEA